MIKLNLNTQTVSNIFIFQTLSKSFRRCAARCCDSGTLHVASSLISGNASGDGAHHAAWCNAATSSHSNAIMEWNEWSGNLCQPTLYVKTSANGCNQTGFRTLVSTNIVNLMDPSHYTYPNIPQLSQHIPTYPNRVTTIPNLLSAINPHSLPACTLPPSNRLRQNLVVFRDSTDPCPPSTSFPDTSAAALIWGNFWQARLRTYENIK